MRPARRQEWLRTLRRAAGTTRGKVGLTMTLLVVLVAAIGPFVASYSPTQILASPFAQPSSTYHLGVDVLGRDVLSRLFNGGWQLLLMALAATAFGIVVGAVAGISAAYLRGRADELIMRTIDITLAFPTMVLALLLVSMVGPKFWLIILAVGFSHAPQVARVLRSATLDIAERDFVRTIELDGVSNTKIMFREILPNLSAPLMVETGLRLTYSIVIMAGLAFLGFGIPPPTPNWGQMVSENEIGLSLNVWGVAAPSILIALLTVGMNTFTDAIARVTIGIEGRDNVGLVTEVEIRT